MDLLQDEKDILSQRLHDLNEAYAATQVFPHYFTTQLNTVLQAQCNFQSITSSPLLWATCNQPFVDVHRLC